MVRLAVKNNTEISGGISNLEYCIESTLTIEFLWAAKDTSEFFVLSLWVSQAYFLLYM